MANHSRDSVAFDVALCAGAIIKDRELADRAKSAAAAMQLWYPHKWNRWPCFACRATGHTHDRHDDGRLRWDACDGCGGQGWFWRRQPGGEPFTDHEVVAIYERELRRRAEPTS